MDRFTDSFLSEVSPDKALQQRLRAEVILGRSLLAKHQQHDQSSHGSWATGGEYTSTDYRMSHRPPDPEDGAPAHDLTGGGLIYPENVYDKDGARIYGGGDTEMGQRVQNVLRSIRGNPNAKVQIYRAVPKGVNRVNVGDWVSVDLAYAEQHGRSNLNNDYDILANTVNADEIYNDGNSLYEWSYHPRVKKHLAGQHDQRTHGSWAGGGAGVDITSDMDKLFYNSDGNINQETQNVINEIIVKSSVGKESGDIALKIIAERQGFTGLPKTVKTITELKQLQEAEGGILVYRGLSDYSADSAQRNENTGNVSYSAKQGVTDFRQGDYHAGYGAFGNGIYSTVKPDEASSYSNDEDEDSGSLGNGKVMAMHIPKNAKMPTKEQVQSAMKLVNYDVIEPTHRNNVARVLVSQGFQAYNAGFIQDDKKDYFVILDRSMLTVAEQDWTFGL